MRMPALPGRTGSEPVNATRDTTDVPTLGMTTMCAAATWFLDQPALPRHQSVELFSRDFRAYLDELMPRVRRLVEARSSDDVPAQVALAGIGEAELRMHEPQAVGLCGEVDRVKRLARSVLALCDHHDALTGMTMCLTCDEPIEVGDGSVPYDQFSPSGGAARSGRIHARCADTVRRSR